MLNFCKLIFKTIKNNLFLESLKFLVINIFICDILYKIALKLLYIMLRYVIYAFPFIYLRMTEFEIFSGFFCSFAMTFLS